MKKLLFFCKKKTFKFLHILTFKTPILKLFKLKTIN
jgi:hypothetical protein